MSQHTIQPTAQPTVQRTVHMFVPDALADWEVGYATAQINTPGTESAKGRYRVKTVGSSRRPVTSMGGVTIVPDMTLAQLTPSDSAMLILPGGTSWDDGRNTDAVEKARAFLAADVPVAAICGATAGLARGGLLDDREHTSNAPEYLEATGYKGRARYRVAPAVTAGNLITASAMGALDFARHVLAKLELYPPAVLDAWYLLFKTGDPKHYAALVEAATIAA
jgi:putative intracellular protease/amidase